tara:strand:+ start:2241 stop:2531 length:291 start_codon:yes stop_codon:yes gene_type:complete
MGRAFNLTIPASGVGVDPVPVSVSGQTFFSGEGVFQYAYDPADFDSSQFSEWNLATGNAPMFHFPSKTILWVRQNPTAGAPATPLYIHTCIGEEGY